MTDTPFHLPPAALHDDATSIGRAATAAIQRHVDDLLVRQRYAVDRERLLAAGVPVDLDYDQRWCPACGRRTRATAREFVVWTGLAHTTPDEPGEILCRNCMTTEPIP